MAEITYKYCETEQEILGAYELTKMKENNYWLGGSIIPPILRKDSAKKGVVIAKDGEKVVGFIQFNTRIKDRVSVIYHRCVHPDYRGKGIALKLSKMVPPPYESKCRPDNMAIQQLYKKLGMKLYREDKYTTKKGTPVHVLVYRSESLIEEEKKWKQQSLF